MDAIFSDQIGHNPEVYINNMTMKTHEEGSHYRDLEDILESVRRYNMNLNPTKCPFGVQARKSLGIYVDQKGDRGEP